MKYPSIRIEGAILSADILDKIEQGDLLGQKTKDFGFTGSNVRVKDEIVRAWADAQDMWRIFNRKMDALPDHKAGTTETRNFWIVPLLGLLGYEVELYRKAQDINGKTYAISHYASNIDHFPVHIMGFRDSLDQKRQDSGPRMSPHALIQEYINLHEHLFAIVTNGLTIRLLRDSSRLIKLSFVEFDLERMFEEEHFADFALLFRLIHCSRMPGKQAEGPESLIEGYHQDSLDSGSRIRDGLSKAVEHSIRSMANGFLSHRDNTVLRQTIIDGDLLAKDFYQSQLRLIYRLLFLMVIEERDLIFTKSTPRLKKDIYYKYYSVSRLRKLSEKRYLADKRYRDVWISLKNSFKLYETSFYGEKLDVQPLAGDLFSANSIGYLSQCQLNNKVLLECLNNLSVFTNPDTHQKMRVNYASLNVEEFGSVYEGLLEYDPVLDVNGDKVEFRLVKGSGRSSSGSHYTPDELVQPLIKHSLSYIIEDKLKESNPEKALLSITVCDVACGSGHFLLGAARRIATELAKVRTSEDQPSPSAFREAVRDVIRHCIYGVDLNPLAVELAKVALWLEAHNPGEPLNFLDHKIKCGDAIVGLAHLEELENGIANEAFKKLSGDDDTARTLAKKNKAEKQTRQRSIDFDKQVGEKIEDVNAAYAEFSKLPESTPEEITTKQKSYQKLSSGANWWRLKTLADIQTAQFFIPKTIENSERLITENSYRDLLSGSKPLQGSVALAKASAIAAEKHFFHWFLEFPEIFASGGFDSILGNPPYLGGSKISTNFGASYLNILKTRYSPTQGVTDLVAYFLRRIYSLQNKSGFLALITTNTISQGDTRNGGLEQILAQKGIINFTNKSVKWPGTANLEVSLIGISRSSNAPIFLNGDRVDMINSFLRDEPEEKPNLLSMNKNKAFIGVYILGNGFIIDANVRSELINSNPKNSKIINKYLTGDLVNNSIDHTTQKFAINFFKFSKEQASAYDEAFAIVEGSVRVERQRQKDKRLREFWWHYKRHCPDLYNKIGSKSMVEVLVTCKVTKHLNFIFADANQVFDIGLNVFAFDDYAIFAQLQTSFHEMWSRIYGSTLESRLRYTNEDCFETFPFPKNAREEVIVKLGKIGKNYSQVRKQLMLKIQLGLTKTYNQFHNPHLSNGITSSQIMSRAELQKTYGKETVNLWNHLQKTEGVCSMEEAVSDIVHLRQLHKEMDEAVLEAYGWHVDSEKWGPAIDLAHDFFEVDYLTENDRVRYTISPEARKEVLKRLLLLNHEIYEEEVKQGLHGKKKAPKTATKKKSKVANDPDQGSLFSGKSVTPNTATRQKVSHPKFGQGIVLKTEGHGENAKLTIQFESGEKKLQAKFVTIVK
jgi:hypothetical protein